MGQHLSFDETWRQAAKQIPFRVAYYMGLDQSTERGWEIARQESERPGS